MISLQQIESNLKDAIKARDQITVDVLRGLKTRVTNEQIAKMSAKGGSLPAGQAGASGGRELSEDALTNLVRSEIKKRKESAEAFEKGGRTEMAEKELKELSVLAKYLPAQMSNEEIAKIIDAVVAENNFMAKDFGQAMGGLKARLGASADGATLAKLLKEKLK